MADWGSGDGGRGAPVKGLIALGSVLAVMTVGTFLGALSRHANEAKSSPPSAPWAFSMFVAKASVGVFLILLIVACVLWMIRSFDTVLPDKESGLVALSRRQGRAVAVQGYKSFHATKRAAASVAFPSLTHLNARSDQIAELATPVPVVTGPPKAPMFPQLIKEGLIHKGEIPIAWDGNKLLQGTPKRLRSGGVIAQSGGGKSTLFAGQITWARSCDFAVFLGDLHAHLDDSTTARIGPLAKHLFAPVAATPDELVELADYLLDAWDTILAGRPHELTGRNVYICFDEFMGIRSRKAVAPAVEAVTERVASEAGKANWTGWVGGQQGTKDAIGKFLRDLLKTRLVLGGLDRADAGRWLDVKVSTLPDHMKHLDPGECYLNSREGLVHGQVPWLPDETIEELAARLDALAAGGEQATGSRLIIPDAIVAPPPAALEEQRSN